MRPCALSVCDPIPVRIADFDDIEARLWAISENLHRNELSALERAEQITEFARLSERMRTSPRPSPRLCSLRGSRSPPPRQRFRAKLAQNPGRSARGRQPSCGEGSWAHRAGSPPGATIAALPDAVKAKAVYLGLDRNQSALLDTAKAPTMETQISTLERRAERAPVPLATRPQALRNLENISAGTLALWIKETTPNDRLHVIDVLERAAAILRDEMQAERREAASKGCGRSMRELPR